jgi:hypothetical protein
MCPVSLDEIALRNIRLKIFLFWMPERRFDATTQTTALPSKKTTNP